MQEPKIHSEPDRAAAVDILLLMADAGARWHEYGHALALLDHAELASGALTHEYEMKRRRWQTR